MGKRVGAHGVARREVKDVGAALLLAQLVVAQSHIEDDGLLGLRQVGDGDQVRHFEVGDDDGGAIAKDLFCRLRHVAVGGDDRFFEHIVLTDETAALVVLDNGKTRALHPLVGDNLVEQGQRHRLVIGLAQVVDGDLRSFRRGGRRLFSPRRADNDPDHHRREEKPGKIAGTWQRNTLRAMDLGAIRSPGRLHEGARAAPLPAPMARRT